MSRTSGKAEGHKAGFFEFCTQLMHFRPAKHVPVRIHEDSLTKGSPEAF